MLVTHTRSMTLLSTLVLSVFTMAVTADAEPKQVAIETKFVEIRMDALDELGFDWLLTPISGGDPVSLPELTSPGVQAVDTTDLSPILRALESSRGSRVISEPRIAVQQDKPSEIGSSKARDLGLDLQVTPHVTPDGTIDLDLSVRNANTTISIPSGQSVLIGGLVRERESAPESGVPVLSKIPYVGRLFRKESPAAEERNLLIFVTPRIIGPEGSGGGGAPAADAKAKDSAASKAGSVGATVGSAVGSGIGATTLTRLGGYLPREEWDVTVFGRGEISSTELEFDSGSFMQNGQKQSFSGDDSDFDRNALTVGARLGLPELQFIGNDIHPFISAQLGYATLDVDDTGGDVDPALSYGLSGGAYVDVLDRLRIYTDLTYRDDLKHDLSGTSPGGGAISGDVDLSMIRARLGLVTALGAWVTTRSFLDQLVLYGGVDLTRQTAEVNERATYTDMYLNQAFTQVVAAEFVSTMLGVHGGLGYNFGKYGMVNFKLALAAGATLAYLEYDLWQWMPPRRCCVWPF